VTTGAYRSQVTVVYLDETFRVTCDLSGAVFVYTRALPAA